MIWMSRIKEPKAWMEASIDFVNFKDLESIRRVLCIDLAVSLNRLSFYGWLFLTSTPINPNLSHPKPDGPGT
jgi:hypothetical protein